MRKPFPHRPAHVLVDDREAEHIPGCNMAFRRDWLEAVGGFDPQFRCAGDDVDLCWNVQRIGGRIGFHAGALVWHHRRSSVVRYWKQQLGYGKAEALLSRKWPEKYNSAGHIPWSGRIYGRGLTLPVLGRAQRIYHGVWGSAPFQFVYQPAQGALGALPLLPEWYLLIAGLAGLSALGMVWPPLRIARSLFESMGIKTHTIHYSVSSGELVTIIEGAAEQMAAVEMVIMSSGAFMGVSSLELVSIDQMNAAMTTASQMVAKYQAPNR